MTEDAKQTLALTNIPGVGITIFHQLIDKFGTPGEVLAANAEVLSELPSMSRPTLAAIIEQRESALEFAETQLRLAERFGVDVITISDSKYPRRLRNCPDAPAALFAKGEVNFETAKVLSVVGTREPTPEGRELCESVVYDLCMRHPDMIVVSGLAFGIDVTAHKAALRAERNTIGVVGHGLNRIYPAQHRDVAANMVRNGGAIVSEYPFGTDPDKYNFVARNRIIAGLADATLVVESDVSGGSMRTARNAFDYDRLVLAFPGFPDRAQSAGCNNLIKNNVAALVENADDIDKCLGWDNLSAAYSKEGVQANLFQTPQTPEEQAIVDALRAEDGLTSSAIGIRCHLPINVVNVTLLSMEFSGLVKSLPGNCYKLMI